MSIINDALKKARRQAAEPGTPPSPQPTEPDDAPIQPRSTPSGKRPSHTLVPALFLVLLFLGLLGGLGYFVYTEYLASPGTAPAKEAQTAVAKTDRDEPKPKPVEDNATEPPSAPPSQAKPDPAGKSGIVRSTVQALPKASPSEATTPNPTRIVERSSASVPVTPPAPPPELLSRFSINGVMRGGSGDRLLTNSVVYREGDPIASPRGFSIVEIKETTVVIAGPEGGTYSVPLP